MVLHKLKNEMSVLENTKFSAVVSPSISDKYVDVNPKADIENNIKLPEGKGILKNKNQDMENDIKAYQRKYTEF